MVAEFINEPYTDFAKEDIRHQMRQALRQVSDELGQEHDLIIGSRRVKAAATFDSINPSDPDQVVGTFQRATAQEAQAAIQEAVKAFQAWRWAARAEYLFQAARAMRRRRLELNAWMILEEGKSWLEADADVAEAIDFCEFYGREMLRLAEEQPLTRISAEKNQLIYIPLGVGVVIPPWNFPLAILVGMTTAALVAGNTVVLKPSSDSPAMGYKFMEILQEVGLPPGVVNFVTGSGTDIGGALVGHPQTRFISFTGSKEVGLRIVELAARTAPGQMWIKRVVAEMGGKDAIIVDREVDLDAAVQGVLVSAYGYQGQKCSACSRAMVDKAVYDEFLARLAAKAEKLAVGPADDPANYMGPVINERARRSILDYIEIGKREGRLLAGGGPAPGEGYFIQPTIIADVGPEARIFQEEVFGPVLAVTKARDFEHALELANQTEYGLTGAVYSRNREKLERARREFFVGNLYFNRKCTGALVGVHPFGGFNMSGTDSKAGGRDYLGLFLQAKVVCEKL
jgi:1-pyrroline-5-carboxylate dehydrogenase